MVKWVQKTVRGQIARTHHHRRVNYLVNERFQWRYTRYLIVTVLIGSVITGGVTAYFLNQNYEIFNRLAYIHAPELLPQLEREQVWINSFLVAFVFTILGFNLFFGLRMTSRIAGPVMVLKKHLRMLSFGRFFEKPLRVRETDEFRDLIEAYNYLYQTLQAQIRKDIKKIRKALDEPHRSQQTLENLLEEKTAQITELSAESDSTADSRHVS